MSDAVNRLRRAVVDRALTGPGVSSQAARQAAFENHGVAPSAQPLLETVARNAWKVTREDVAATKAAGVSEDEIFELVVCAALGQATRQLETALAALEAAADTASLREPDFGDRR
jgi:hypothetical protein